MVTKKDPFMEVAKVMWGEVTASLDPEPWRFLAKMWVMGYLYGKGNGGITIDPGLKEKMDRVLAEATVIIQRAGKVEEVPRYLVEGDIYG